MPAVDYVADGGPADWRVPDLVPQGVSPRLVIVFESPHVDELKAVTPVAGSAGRSAMRFLRQNAQHREALGPYVKDRLNTGRVAILNVSSVPLQKAAFKTVDPPDLSQTDWALLERVRTSGAKRIRTMRSPEARSLSRVLADDLRSRIEELDLIPETRVAAAGRFAQRMVREFSDDLGLQVLEVPHPSYNLWNRPANEAKLEGLRELFASACPE